MTANTLADGSSPRWLPVLSSWTSDLPGGQDGSRGLCVQLRATTPLPLRASDSRWLSPVVVTTCAWCRSRSTVAVADGFWARSPHPDRHQCSPPPRLLPALAPT